MGTQKQDTVQCKMLVELQEKIVGFAAYHGLSWYLQGLKTDSRRW
jgi:hypothetical protein